jgi:RNA-directed DNA polymerase
MCKRTIGVPQELGRSCRFLSEIPAGDTGSYGFGPGRSARQALDAFRGQLMNCRGGYVLEVDIRKFFDTLDHGHLWTMLQLRVRDGVLLRLIGK